MSSGGMSMRAKLWVFVCGTAIRFLSWVFVAFIVAAIAKWESDRAKRPNGAVEVTGTERPANLSRLNEGSPGEADPAEQSNKQNFALASGIQEAKIDYEVYLNPDCTPRTNFYLYLRQKPRNGTVRIDLDKNYTGYDNDSQRYKCNLSPVESPSIFYRRNPGFTGKDAFTVEVFEPNGFVRTTRYLIDAR
jgi:hypothetical protein